MDRRPSRLKKNIFWLLFLGFVFRLILSPFGTLSLDQNTFIAWSKRLFEVGPKGFYDLWSDYLPGFLYILWPLGKFASLGAVKIIIYKLPAIFADIAVSYLIYKIVSKNSKKLALLAAGIFIFNPAIIANSTLWGQVDIFTALFSLLAVYLLDKYLFSSILLAIGVLFKPQTVLAGLPIFILLLQKKKPILLVKYAIGFLVTFVALFAPFNSEGALFSFIRERLTQTLSQYPYASINAFNFWGLFGFWQKDLPIYFVLGSLIIISLFAYVFKKRNGKVGTYEMLSLIMLLGFIFGTRLHERHLLPVLAPLAIVAVKNKTALFSYIGLSAAYVLNLLYSYVWISGDFLTIFPPIVVKLIILINIVFTFLFVGALVGKKSWLVEGFFKMKKILSKKRKKGKLFTEKIKIPKKKRMALLSIIIAFSFVSRIYNLGDPPKEYFDEVYHVFTARIALNGDPKAWEWWNKHPEGFAYEWTHPPVAKIGMMLGMGIFGENAFGWRVAQALLGTASIYLVYLIAKKIFKDELSAIFAAGILSLEGLFLVMSRIGMNDIFLVTFGLFSLYFVMKKRMFLSALFLGLSMSSKWSAVWFVPVLIAAYFVFNKSWRKNISKWLWFLVVPPLVYLASYIPMFLTGHDLGTFVGVQKQMWWYHTRLDATHAYTSSWWSWPVLARPVYLYTSDEISGMVSRIYAFGNPLVFWTGLVSIFYAAIYSYKHKAKRLGFVVFSYFVVFASWSISPRIMFLYHYLPAIPFVAIALGFLLRKIWETKKGKKVVAVIFLLFFLSYVYFYPHWAGLEIPIPWDDSYYWLSNWR